MFFLSKFLPLFIYPLGLTFLLMTIAIAIFWRYPKWSAISLIGALTILLLASNGWISQELARSLEWQYLLTGEVPNAEAIVVLGGGIKPASYPRQWIEVNEAGDRVIYGAKLYREGKAPWLILSGGRIDWKDGGNSEAADMAELAQTMGVPSSAIIQEQKSFNTYSNAVNVRKILESKGIKGNILLVTSALHMPRSILIFENQKISTIPAATDFFVTQQDLEDSQNWQMFLLNLVPSAKSLDMTTKALKEYVGLIVYHLLGWL
ncbi:MAG: hypothetical protein RLZZ338_2909 [Cyanobacteriota bacterium]|jgi:uncharacterized SAM-binding protein YcdF (DUF218 family)